MRADAWSNDAYVINLDRDKDRLSHALRQHSALRRWPGVVMSSNRSLRSYARFFREDFDYAPPVGQLGNYGCSLSHLTLLEHAQRSTQEVIFVFEDDFVLCRPFAELVKAVNRFPPDWDIINLAGWVKKDHQQPVIERIVYEGHEYKRVLTRKAGVSGTFGLAFKRASIPTILELAKREFGSGGARGGTRFADTLFLRIVPEIRYYLLERGVFVDHEDLFPSSRDTINLGSLLVRVVRKVAQLLKVSGFMNRG